MPLGPTRGSGAPPTGLSSPSPAGALRPLEPPTPCELLQGIFLVHRCGQPAVARCVRCQNAACPTHLRHPKGGPPGEYWCTDCVARSRQRDVVSNAPSFGESSSSAPETWSGGGGQFSGGGASGSWDSAGLPTPSGTAEAPFSAADFAAFDSLVANDVGSVSHDS